MFHLLHGLYLYLSRRKEYSLLILGLDNAGKTTFLETAKACYDQRGSGPVSQNFRILPTVGQNVGFVQTHDGTLLKIWDVGGQHSLRRLWHEYFSAAHGILFVVDSTDRERLQECVETLRDIVQDGDTDGLPVLMLANKQDEEEAMEVEEIKEIFNPLAVALEARDSRVLPVVALDGTGVKEALDWIVVRMQRSEARPPRFR